MQKKLIAVGTALAMFATATPAFAAVNSSSVTILVTNRGSITNVTQADSHTGLNTALGSLGGTGGLGGDVTSSGSENNGGASAGNGGNGGNGGAGGLITTGDASAEAGSENGLNGTDLEVAFDCECGDLNSVTIDAEVDNDDPSNNIDNTTQARGRTGDNTALGSAGGNAGNGGEVDGGPGSENNGGASAGTGGAGGSGGLGGEIHTGAASSTSGSINLLNTTFVRVRM
ncbi:hypothetical protein COU18_01090 [Candidatus Kaiserbacteria bacterium CG10_big_fil_rev_8_21_14_0_10_51_14]|uniref:PE-PGRS family protein n=1 Tax=Candidatus Kaiserbacteria bacterium CG10_big_fil_rev_8_21_14_0_10_51_14 TaxID=1974610 RepID=A0A2H0UE86_9BACT|nr:MAG: hypothetical protein COU18_01090 [Candidatus Kaiserbacteria bacterium CG10_big_fil_rev_8_21_14_0_10_51_14]